MAKTKTLLFSVVFAAAALGAGGVCPERKRRRRNCCQQQSGGADYARARRGRQPISTEGDSGRVGEDGTRNSTVKTVSADANGAEIRVERGRANVQVTHPADHAKIVVDLPGGQTSLLKDGLYTFNAETNTVRVLRGEAESYTDANGKATKVKEEHELSFARGRRQTEGGGG